MSVDLQSIPRDADGSVDGAYYIWHDDAAFCEELGPVCFRDGRSIKPVSGTLLVRMVAGLGADIARLERATDYDVDPEHPEGGSVGILHSELEARTTAQALADEEAAARRALQALEDRGEQPAMLTEDDPDPEELDENGAHRDDGLPRNREVLIAVARARGLEVGDDWSRKRLKKALAAAKKET